MAAPEVPRWRPRRGRSAEGAGLVLSKTSVPSPTTSGFNPKMGKPAGRPHRFIGDKPISAHCVTLPPDPPPSNRGVKWSRARHGQAPCPPPRGRGQPYGYGTCPPLPDADAPPVDGLRRPPWACPAMLKQFPEYRGLAPDAHACRMVRGGDKGKPPLIGLRPTGCYSLRAAGRSRGIESGQFTSRGANRGRVHGTCPPYPRRGFKPLGGALVRSRSSAYGLSQ